MSPGQSRIDIFSLTPNRKNLFLLIYISDLKPTTQTRTRRLSRRRKTLPLINTPRFFLFHRLRNLKPCKLMCLRHLLSTSILHRFNHTFNKCLPILPFVGTRIRLTGNPSPLRTLLRCAYMFVFAVFCFCFLFVYVVLAVCI